MKGVLKVKNKHLIGLGSWLNELSLAGRESRERTRFVDVLVKQINENQKFSNEILAKYVEKDKEGNWKKKKTDRDEVWQIPDDKLNIVKKEQTDLLEEEFVIDVNDGNLAKVKTVRDLVLNTDYKFGPKEGDDEQQKLAKIRQANDYEDWCKAFEDLEI